MTALLAILWLSATQHCTWEALGVWGTDPCCHVSGCSPNSTLPAPGDACPAMEFGQCLGCPAKAQMAAPATGGIPARALRFPAQAERPRPRPQFTSVAPPDFLAGWQFILRVAVTSRAPACRA